MSSFCFPALKLAFFAIFSTLPQNQRCKHFQVVLSIRVSIPIQASVSILLAMVFNAYVHIFLQNSESMTYNDMNNRKHGLSGAHHTKTVDIRLVRQSPSSLWLANLGWAILCILLILHSRKWVSPGNFFLAESQENKQTPGKASWCLALKPACCHIYLIYPPKQVKKLRVKGQGILNCSYQE